MLSCKSAQQFLHGLFLELTMRSVVGPAQRPALPALPTSVLLLLLLCLALTRRVGAQGSPVFEASSSSGEGQVHQQLLKHQEQPHSHSDPHSAITKWLDSYLASQKEEEQQKALARLEGLRADNGSSSSSSGGESSATAAAAGQQRGKGRHVELLELREVQLKKLAAGAVAAALGARAPPAVTVPPCELGAKEGPVRRNNLIIAPVGDSFNASIWLSDPQRAKFDLVLVHYGSNASFDCPLCKKVYRATGPKWKLAYWLFTLPEWRELSTGYDSIMVADDDLIMDTCILNRAFDIAQEYGLLMAQPSVCQNPQVHTVYKPLYQQPEFTLRYMTFIEIMAPIFNTSFYNNFIAPSLHDAHTGWGLDFVWPFLLRYPRDKIAVIDEVCVFHPHSAAKRGAKSLYEVAAPYDKYEELRRLEAEFNYTPAAVAKLGFPFRPVQEVGGVLRPEPELEPMQKPAAVAAAAASAVVAAAGPAETPAAPTVAAAAGPAGATAAAAVPEVAALPPAAVAPAASRVRVLQAKGGPSRGLPGVDRWLALHFGRLYNLVMVAQAAVVTAAMVLLLLCRRRHRAHLWEWVVQASPGHVATAGREGTV